MAFIDELMQESNPMGITVEESKAHDAIDKEIALNQLNNLPLEVEEFVQNFVMGGVGAGKAGSNVIKKILSKNKDAIKNLTKDVGATRPPMRGDIIPLGTKIHQSQIPYAEVARRVTPRSIDEGTTAYGSGLAATLGSIIGLERGTPDWANRLINWLIPDPEIDRTIPSPGIKPKMMMHTLSKLIK